MSYQEIIWIIIIASIILFIILRSIKNSNRSKHKKIISDDTIENLKILNQLKNEGIISQDDFDDKKSKLLKNI
jgi:ribosomal protein S8